MTFVFFEPFARHIPMACIRMALNRAFPFLPDGTALAGCVIDDVLRSAVHGSVARVRDDRAWCLVAAYRVDYRSGRGQPSQSCHQDYLSLFDFRVGSEQ